ncbi:hypothetical protein CYMTET_50665 [Cymbomonas tetramitiformis]|uniref:Tyrosine-protein kinase ephrin type A/B receptor-like domain-containing protein n=1 Tax=Cymbomonas tetramitiformis TaxID=36881 RepID=A0AAE0EUI7_9CHLO|nr:hypothetical protein CYMTET_50665 [Cymbomonas tetramitiformis]
MSNCISPFEVTWLEAGNHTFMLIATLESGVNLSKQHRWTVAPRLRFTSDTVYSTLSSVQNQRTEFLELQPTSEDAVYITSTDFFIEQVQWWENIYADGNTSNAVEQSAYSDSSQLQVHTSKGTHGVIELDLISSSMVNITSTRSYTVVVVVGDNHAIDFTSVVNATIFLTVYAKSTLLLIPSSGDVIPYSGQQVRVVVAGQDVLVGDVAIINVGTGINSNNGRTACSAATTFNITAQENQTWVWVEPSNGTMSNIGDIQTLRIVVLQKLDKPVTHQIATFRISNTADGVLYMQELRVLLTVVADVISNQSIAKIVDDGLALKTGDSAKWAVTALDRFSNALTEGDAMFLVDVFRTELQPATRKELDGQTPVAHFNESTARYTSQVDSIVPYGAYAVYVRFVDRKLQQEALEKLPASNWTDPQGCALLGLPLEYYFSPVLCYEDPDHQVADESGMSCECSAGYYNTMADTDDDHIFCKACGYGRYGRMSTSRGQDEACSLCSYEGSTDGLTTLRPDARTLEECVCTEGYYHTPDNLQQCTACEPGFYQDQPNSSSCAACPIGTHSQDTGRADVCSQQCVEREVAPREGLAECLHCAPNTRTEYACLVNGSWYEKDLVFCLQFAAETIRAMCLCDDGFYQSDSDDNDTFVNQTCERCSEGAKCEYGLMRGLAGYWRMDTGKTKFYKCTPEDACLGEVTSETYSRDSLLDRYFTTRQVELLESSQLSSCREGHAAVLCGACEEGWGLGDDGSCEDCGIKRSGLAYILLLLTVVLLAMWLQRPFYQDVEVKMKQKAVSVVRQARATSVESLTQIRHHSGSALQQLRAAGEKLQNLIEMPSWKAECQRCLSDVHKPTRSIDLECTDASLTISDNPLQAAPSITQAASSIISCDSMLTSFEEPAGADMGTLDDMEVQSNDTRGELEQEHRKDVYAKLAADTQKCIQMQRMRSSTSTNLTNNRTKTLHRAASEAFPAGNIAQEPAVVSSESIGSDKTIIMAVLKEQSVQQNVTKLADFAQVATDDAPTIKIFSESPGSDVSSLMQIAAVLLGFSQILASYITVYNVSWPDGFSNFLRALMVLNFSIPKFPGLPDISCSLTGTDFLTTHAACIWVPFGGVAFMHMIATISFRMQKKRRHMTDPIQYQMFVIRSASLVLYISYICISTVMLSYFNCVAVHDEYYLVADLQVQCWVGPHRRYLPLAVIGVLLYPIGLPAFFYMLMIKYHVPLLAKMKRRACLLHAAREKLDPTYDAESIQDPLFALETITIDELSTLVSKIQKAPSSKRGSELGNSSNGAAGAASSKAAMHLPSTSSSLVHRVHTCRNNTRGDAEVLIDKLLEWMLMNNRDMLNSLRVYWNDAAGSMTDEKETRSKGPVQTRWARLEAQAIMRAGFIFSAYHAEAWWYDIADLLRKLCLACAIVYLGESSITQILVAMAICFAAICANLSLHPDATSVVQIFTTTTHGVLFYTLVLGNYISCTETTAVGEAILEHLLIWPVSLVYVAFFVYVAIFVRRGKKFPMRTDTVRIFNTDSNDAYENEEQSAGINTRHSIAMSSMDGPDDDTGENGSADRQDEHEMEKMLNPLSCHTTCRAAETTEIVDSDSTISRRGRHARERKMSIAMAKDGDLFESEDGAHPPSNDFQESYSQQTELQIRINPLFANIKLQ